MSEFVSVDRINALKSGIESKTGETYTDLTAGVQALVDGYGQGGGGEDYLAGRITNTLVEYTNSDITNVTQYAFYACNTLKKIMLPKVVSVGDNSFRACKAIEKYDFRSVVTINQNGFYEATIGDVTDDNFSALYEIYKGGLRSTKIVNFVKPNSTVKFHATCMESNNLLKKVDVRAIVWGNNNQSLGFAYNCNAFDTFIIRRTDAVNVWCGWSGGFSGTAIGNGTGYIYVPSALVDSYKAATGWANWAEQIRAIEDYPEITGG